MAIGHLNIGRPHSGGCFFCKLGRPSVRFGNHMSCWKETTVSFGERRGVRYKVLCDREGDFDICSRSSQGQSRIMYGDDFP